MNKPQRIAALGFALLSVGALAACAPQKIQTEAPKQEITKKKIDPATESKKDVESDVAVLLDNMFTTTGKGFSRLYGDNYERWAAQGDEESIKEWLEMNGMTNEAAYTTKIHDAPQTPSQIYGDWLEARREMFRDLPDDYKIDSIELDGEDRATVTFTAAGVNSTELAARVRELKSQILSDDWVLVINGSDDAELKKRDLIVTFYILEGMVRNEFMDVPSAFAETPIVKDQQFEIDLVKNNDGEWVIELEDFKALVSDLMIQGGYEADQES